jgi:hypothetical protein
MSVFDQKDYYIHLKKIPGGKDVANPGCYLSIKTRRYFSISDFVYTDRSGPAPAVSIKMNQDMFKALQSGRILYNWCRPGYAWSDRF